MKPQILLLALVVTALSSCTTAYKTGQTPDDVYFSPVQPQDEYARVEKNDRRYESREEYYDDRYLRMRVYDRTRWSELDDWYYYGGRHDYSYYNSSYINNPWSPCGYWNNYYNPYYHSYVIVKPSSLTVHRPRMSNLNTYNNNNLLSSNNYSNPKGGSSNIFRPNFFNSNNGSSNSGRSSGSSTGNFLRNIFNNNNSSSGSSSNSSSSSSSSSKPSSSSSSSSSSSGSSGGGSAPVRKF